MKTIIWFIVCTFMLTYVAHGALAYLTHMNYIEFNSFLGQSLFIIGGSSPTVFAFVFIYRQKDNTVKTDFKNKLLSFNHSIYFWSFALFVPLVLGGLFQLITILLSNHTFSSELPLYFFFMVIFTSVIFGGLEEIGWRGFLQEHLIGRANLIKTGLIIGVIWGLWHVPLFFVEAVSHYTFSFIPYMLGAIMFSTYLTWLYAKTKSIILAVIFHASINASATIGLRLEFEDTALTYSIIIGFTLVGLGLLKNQDKSKE